MGSVPFPEKWAVLVGATEYKSMPKLRFSRQDVIDLAAALQDPLEFKTDHILCFHEESSLKPARDEIFTKLSELRDSGQVKPEHLLMFFFSGHGMQLNGKDYLITPNAGPSAPKLAIKVEDLVEDLNAFGCNNVVMFIDACRQPLDDAKGSGMGLNTTEAAKRTGIVTFFSCDPKDLSFEIEEYKHGSFTKGVLDAIADGDVTTVRALNNYLQTKVPEINKAARKPLQQPYAVVEPLDKENLEIFYNAKRELYWDEKYRPLTERLCDTLLENDATLGVSIIEFMDRVKKAKGRIEVKDSGLIAVLESYAQGNLSLAMLKIVWERNQKQRQGAPIAGAPQMLTITGKPQTSPVDPQ